MKLPPGCQKSKPSVVPLALGRFSVIGKAARRRLPARYQAATSAALACHPGRDLLREIWLSSRDWLRYFEGLALGKVV